MSEPQEKRYKITQGEVTEGGLFGIFFGKSEDEAVAKFERQFDGKIKYGVEVKVETLKD